jgi:IS5 family transposase
MPKQTSFADLEWTTKKKQTRRERFLTELDAVTPWAELLAVIAPHYPDTCGKRGRPSKGLEKMLRMYVLQQCYGLADEATEDQLYDSQSARRFVGVGLEPGDIPDAGTLLNFRHLLEAHGLTRQIFETINANLSAQGLMMREGTVVDATIIAAPPSTKNRDKRRDPEMHQTRKGNNWYFGMKAHIGVDAKSGLVHTVLGTAANVADVTQTEHLLHGEERAVFADAGYTGADKRTQLVERELDWQIAARRSRIKRLPEGSALRKITEALERAKASVRAKVEHPFHVVKNQFKHRKTRYKGLMKNTAQLYTLFGLANLVLVRKHLLTLQAQGAP